jgi:co-chaperonin GroES (HSP10)
MTTIRPLGNAVMFQFLDETSGPKGKFTDRRTEGGIILPTLDSGQKLPRWGRVLAAGPDAAVQPGEYVLVEGLQWSFGTEVDGVKMWKTDDEKVILATDDVRETYRTAF